MSDNRVKHSVKEVERRAEKYSFENLPTDYQETITQFSELVGAGKVLDIGCGHGRDVDFFTKHGFEAIGIDPSENMIRYARKNMSGNYLNTSFENFQASTQAFDGVWCNTVMQFFNTREEVPSLMKKISAILKTGGILYITFRLFLPSRHESLKYTRDGEDTVRYRIPKTEAEELLEKDFKIIEENVTETNDPIITFICAKK